jgi:molecular chaperone GrpE
MNIDTSLNPLDVEQALPSTEKSANMQLASPVAGADRKPRSLHADDNDPVKLREQLARVQADFDNARKRSLKEQEAFQEYAIFDTAQALLPVVDSLEQALAISSSNCADLHTGVELIHKQLLDVMLKIGVRPIHALGERFDPRIHHAIATDDTDLVQDGIVVGELQCGYMFKDRLLRPAMVTISRTTVPADCSMTLT